MHEYEIPTPALVIDQVVATRNIDRMADYAKSHDLRLRPHTKTHKLVRMATAQLEAGAAGLTVAKVGEARVMAACSDDLTVGYPALDPPRTAAIAELAKSRTMRVAVDSVLAVDRLSAAADAVGATIGILVDVDTGMHRTGLQEPEQTVQLAQHVDAQPAVRLDGLFTYQGIAGSTLSIEQQQCKVAKVLDQTLDCWKQQGLEAKIISGGSTPTARFSHLVKPLTEIRPGTYIYNDRNCIERKCCTIDDCAARIVATVVSTAVPGKLILDSGSKTLTMDRLANNSDDGGHGLLVDHPDAHIDHLTEEHARVDIRRCQRPPKLGDRVHVIPNHICPCVNLQNQVWFKDIDGAVNTVPVDARGMLS